MQNFDFKPVSTDWFMLNCFCCDDKLQATESVLEKLQLLIYKKLSP